MNWNLEYLPEAEKDLRELDGSQRILVLKAIKKVLQNHLPLNEHRYGKPLGSRSETQLAGLLKIKLRACGLRVVYQLRRTESSMLVIVIGVRADEEVYEIAQKRVHDHKGNADLSVSLAGFALQRSKFLCKSVRSAGGC